MYVKIEKQVTQIIAAVFIFIVVLLPHFILKLKRSLNILQTKNYTHIINKKLYSFKNYLIVVFGVDKKVFVLFFFLLQSFFFILIIFWVFFLVFNRLIKIYIINH